MKDDLKKDNMELWEQVCVTDPAITKRVNTRGGFTAIDAQAQIKRATELWGPYGSAWGVRDCVYMFFPDEQEITLSAIFFYPNEAWGQEGIFEIATDMIYKPGNDSRKKLLTDLTTKALSKLGFNSDVFEGKFDDNKYIAALKNGKPIAEPEPINQEQIDEIETLKEKAGIDEMDFVNRLQKKFKVAATDRLDENQAGKLINALKLVKKNA